MSSRVDGVLKSAAAPALGALPCCCCGCGCCTFQPLTDVETSVEKRKGGGVRRCNLLQPSSVWHSADNESAFKASLQFLSSCISGWSPSQRFHPRWRAQVVFPAADGSFQRAVHNQVTRHPTPNFNRPWLRTACVSCSLKGISELLWFNMASRLWHLAAISSKDMRLGSPPRAAIIRLQSAGLF